MKAKRIIRSKWRLSRVKVSCRVGTLEKKLEMCLKIFRWKKKKEIQRKIQMKKGKIDLKKEPHTQLDEEKLQWVRKNRKDHKNCHVFRPEYMLSSWAIYWDQVDHLSIHIEDVTAHRRTKISILVLVGKPTTGIFSLLGEDLGVEDGHVLATEGNPKLLQVLTGCRWETW